MSHAPRQPRQERASSIFDRAMGRSWPSKRDELLNEALCRSTATQAFYVHRTAGQDWRIGSYPIR